MTISGFAAYVKQLWKNKPDTSTPLSAARLTHIEDGIKGNSDAIEKIIAAVVNQITNDPDKIASMAALYAVNQKVDQQNSDFALWQVENMTFSRNENEVFRIVFSYASGLQVWLDVCVVEQKLRVWYYDGTTANVLFEK